jgi:Arc/MetJ-type ribon-helix-helix transcriptional regulator
MSEQQQGRMNLISLRLPPDLLAKIDSTIEQWRNNYRGKPPDRSEFIRRSITKDFAHLERSRKPRRRRGA